MNVIDQDDLYEGLMSQRKNCFTEEIHPLSHQLQDDVVKTEEESDFEEQGDKHSVKGINLKYIYLSPERHQFEFFFFVLDPDMLKEIEQLSPPL